MTTYGLDSRNDRLLVASWPDLPIEAYETVGPFADREIAALAPSVLEAASRYRWHRMLQLWDEGAFTDERAGPDPIVASTESSGGGATPGCRMSEEPGWLPRLPTEVLLGDSPMTQYMRERIEALIPDREGDPDPVDTPWLFADRKPLGNPGPLLRSDWRRNLTDGDREILRVELEADLAATTGAWTGRARQIAWYLNAELLVGEETWEGVDDEQMDDRCSQLLRGLTGLPVELKPPRSPSCSNLVQVHTPGTLAGFWVEDCAWTYGWPVSESSDDWRVSGRLAPALELTVGELARFIIEGVARGHWPFGNTVPPGGRAAYCGH